MAGPTLDELHAVWATGPGGGDPDVLEVYRTALDLLADGEPVTVDALASASGLAAVDLRGWLRGAREAGYEIDEQDRLVGAALTLRPTPHAFSVRGNELFAWCGFDTLFLPILLGEPARVRSRCPETGRTIRLEVAPDGTVTEADPPDTVVGVVGPQVADACTTTGPDSTVCTQMPLLAGRQAGERWVTDHPGVAVVDLADASGLARAHAGVGDMSGHRRAR